MYICCILITRGRQPHKNYTEMKNINNHSSIRVTQKRTINTAMHVMECPVCGNVVASASERYLLPEFSTCNGLKFQTLRTTLKIKNKPYISIKYGIGSFVEHKRFGKGNVISETKDRIDIEFPEGKKNLLKQFANLKLVQID